jgi:hypothetical protein
LGLVRKYGIFVYVFFEYEGGFCSVWVNVEGSFESGGFER